MRTLKSILVVGDYAAVIPHIQNVYGPEEEQLGETTIWNVGLKYNSGVFEFFSFDTRYQADTFYERILKEINDYWKGK